MADATSGAGRTSDGGAESARIDNSLAMTVQAAPPKTDWYKRILDTVQAVVVIVGVCVALQQLIQVRKNTDHTAYNTVSSEWIKLDRHFIENHELRSYFFEGVKIDEGERNYKKVDATAHYVLNFLDYAISTADHLNPVPSGSFVEKNVWHQYIQRTYFSSPIVCDNLRRYKEGYTHATWKVAEKSCNLPPRDIVQHNCDGIIDGALCWLGVN
jgi:hypothetical protein